MILPVLAAFAFGLAFSPAVPPVHASTAAAASTKGPARPTRDPVEEALARLSLEEKVGQLFMIAIDTEIAAGYEPQIRSGRLGGALLRWDRFTGEEARDFSARMRVWTDSSPARVPLLLCADHEGGPVFTQRRYGGTIFPGNMALGAARSPDWSERSAYVMGRELSALGIQVDFAPSVDVNNNPDNPIIGLRSFGEDPRRVAQMGLAALRGFLRSGTLPAAKHFPGHGNTAVDSHLDLPVIAQSMADWEKMELVPFKAMIRARAPMIMTAHIVVSALDPSLPVTMSSTVLQGFLRGKLGYDGVIVSDSLDMGAITRAYGMPEAAIRSLEAGCDVLLLGKGDFPSSYAEVLAAVKSGRVPMRRLERSVRRILRVKARAGLLGPRRTPPPPFEEVGAEGHQELARRIAEGALTLLRDDEALLPLKLPADKTLVVLLARHNRFAAEAAVLREELRRRHARTEFIEFIPRPSTAAVEEAVAKAAQGDLLLLGTYQIETLDDREQVELYRRLQALGKPIIVASLMNPYDLKNFGAKTHLCSYGITPAAMRALARLLFGEIRPKGRLPVSIPGLYERGSGLSDFKTPRKR